MEIRNEARRRLVEALSSESAPRWTSGEAELAELGRRVLAMKEWLLSGSKQLADENAAFTAEEIMNRLGFIDWRTLGVVNAALHELASQGLVAVLDPGTPAVFSFRKTEDLLPQSNFS